jgi:hypothetical protein
VESSELSGCKDRWRTFADALMIADSASGEVGGSHGDALSIASNRLTPREREVAVLIGPSMTNPEIAQELVIGLYAAAQLQGMAAVMVRTAEAVVPDVTVTCCQACTGAPLGKYVAMAGVPARPTT